jgi:nitrogen-specific signal transduction histidine kinase
MGQQPLIERLIGNIRAGLIAVGTQRDVLIVNPAATAILGLDDHPIEGQPFPQALAAYPSLVGFLQDALLMRTPLDRVELQLLSDSLPKTIGISASPLLDERGLQLGVVVLFKDITQTERSEEQAQLKERLMALGQMAAGLAHEMRNPLASIKVTVGLLRKTLTDPDVTEKLRSIMADVQRLNQSVTDCLAFARPIRLDPKHVQINDVLEKVLNQTVLLEHTYPFEVIRRLAPDLPKTWVDPQQLEIVFFNLINNAIDAVRKRHGTIVISTSVQRAAEEERNQLIVTIADNGEGIPSDRLPKVFLPFFTTKGKGSGLGLANAKKIVDHLQGTIEVTSEPGKHTQFSVHLPVITTLTQEAVAV